MRWPKNTNLVPRDGWTVEIEGCGPKIVSNNWSEFLSQIYVRLASNGKDSHGWKQFYIDKMCRSRPDIESEDDEQPISRAVTGDDAKRWVVTMIEAMKERPEPVSEEEQDRRANICLSCPKKGSISCFGGCGSIAAAIGEMLMGAKSKKIPELVKQHCLCCGCELSVLTTYPIELIHRVHEKIGFASESFPSWCWQRPTDPDVSS